MIEKINKKDIDKYIGQYVLTSGCKDAVSDRDSDIRINLNKSYGILKKDKSGVYYTEQTIVLDYETNRIVEMNWEDDEASIDEKTNAVLLYIDQEDLYLCPYDELVALII